MDTGLLRDLEELAMNAWPALQTKLYDGWVLRFADGYTRRANSVNPLYASSLPIIEKIEFCESEYRSRDIPVTFKLTPVSIPDGIDLALEERGYTKEAETALRLLSLKDRDFYKADDTEAEYELTYDWFEGFLRCTGTTDEGAKTTALKILQGLSCKLVFVAKVVNGEFAGCGYGAIERGYAGIFDIAVHPSHRNKGYAFEIMNRILYEAKNIGATDAYLQVVAGNVPAEKLYDKLGFRELYRYWYRKSV